MPNDIKIGINISDGGTGEKVNKVAKEIKGNLEGAAAAAKRVPEALAAAKMGIDASNAMRSSGPARATRAPTGATGPELKDYGTARGISGATGAASRDFAKQAQGLGGLVHVYATFAANLFAVSAAFSALSKAADTTNMVKGLNQLSVGSGNALGSLAKQLSTVTDGAISMRDAMTATVSASAGGMTNAAILRMGNVAKQASQALGVAMPDALNRISRGITKLEPELLDEIGIMVRVDKTSQDYARTLGKTANALTDFEKRQGFANAVLEQGEKKFGNIKIDANPYAKILASMENIAQTGLELVNKVLSPMLTILSSSPMALATAMGLVASVLLKQALPAIGNLKESMAEAANQAKALALAKAAEAGKGYAAEYAAKQASLHKESKLIKETAIARAKETAKIAIDKADEAAERSVETLVGMEKKITEMQGKGIGKGFAKILAKNIDEISDKDIAKMESSAEASNTKKNTEAYIQQKLAIDSVKQAKAAHTAFEITSNEAKRVSLEETAKITKAMQIADLQYANNTAKIDADSQVYAANALRDQKGLSQAKMTQIAADRALTNSALQNISAQAVANSTIKGFGTSMREAYASVKELRAGKGYIEEFNEATGEATKTAVKSGGMMTGSWTLVKSAIGGATSAIGNALNFMGPWIAAIGIAIAAVTAFYEWMSTAGKEIDKFNNSLDATTASTKLLKDVSKDLFSKEAEDWLTAESMQARANAITGASSAITSMIKDLEKARIASNWWDNLFDGLFTKSRVQKTAEAITSSIKEAISLARPSEAKELFQQRVKEITGSKDLSGVDSNKLSEQSLKSLSLAYTTFSNEVANSAEKLAAPKKAFEALSTAMQAISTSLIPTDNLSKLGVSLMTVGSSLQSLSGDTQGYFQELVRVSKDVSKLSLLPKERGVELAKQSKNLEELSASYGSVSRGIENIVAAQSKLNKLEVKYGETKGGAATGNINLAKQAVKPDTLVKDAYDQQLKILRAAQEGYSKEIAKVSEEFADLAGASIRAGAEKFTSALDVTIAQGALKLSGAIANSITGLGSAEAKAQVALKEIALRGRSNDIMVDLIKENQKNSLAIAHNTAVAERQIVEDKLLALKNSKVAADVSERVSLEAKKVNLIASEKNIARAQSWMTDPKVNLMSNIKQATSPEDIGAAGLLNTTAQQLAKANADKSVLGSEKATVELNKALGQVSEKYTVINREQQNKITLLEGEQKATGQLASATTSMQYQILANTQAENIEKEKSILLANTLKQLNEEYAIRLSKDKNLDSSIKKNYDDQVVALTQKTKEQLSSNSAAKIGRDIADSTKQAAIEAYKVEGLRLQQEQNTGTELSKLDNAKSVLETQKSLGIITEKNYLQEKLQIESGILRLNGIKETASIENTRATALATANATNLAQQAQLSQIKGTDLQRETQLKGITDQLNESRDRANIAADTGLAIANAKIVTDTNNMVQLEKNAQITLRQTEDMNKMVAATESLTSIFGELGTAIGGAGQALLKMSQDDEKYLINKLNLEKQLAEAKEAKDSSKELSAQKALGELDKKQAKDEISNISKVAGASKKMFSEKTAGYKVLNGIEKAMAAFTLAMQVKETAMDIKNFAIKMGLISQEVTAEVAKETAQFAARAASASADVSLTVSTEAAKNAAKTPGVFMSFLNWLGPWGMAAAGVAIAAVLGGGGGGAKVNTAGLTSEDMQKSQGTGQKWVDGKLVDTGGGVFGDSEAKSNSLLNSIDLIKENQIEGLSYDNKSLSILESIDKGIEKTAIALYQTQGISTGSGFGTNEASTSNAGFLGLFASSSSTEIINSGIRIGGTLANATAQQFEDVLKTKTKSGFLGIGGGTSQILINNIKDLNNTATEGLQEIFTNMGNLFVEQGKQLGMSTEDLKTSISSLPIEVTASLQGLKGKELREELGYVLSGIADDAANKLFPALRQYRQFGEGMSETVARVLDSNNKYKLSLASIGIATNEVKEELLPVSQVLIDAVTTAQAKVAALKIDTRTVDVMLGYGNGDGYSEMLTTISDPQIAKDLADANSTLNAAQLALTEATGQMTTKSIGLSEILIKNAGGLEQFLEEIKFFGDTFLTEADRLAPKQKAVTEEMSRLGYSSVDTREEFKTLVQGLDLTTAAGRTNYQALMNVAEGFDTVTSAAEAAAEKTRDLQKGLLSAQGRSNDVLAMDRAQALADKSLTESDALILKATYAQEDLNKTRSLENQLLTLQGRSSEVLVRTREAELLSMSKIDAELKLRTYEAEDLAKIKDKELALLNAQGLAYDALIRTRAAELESLRYTGETVTDLGKAAKRTSDTLISTTKATYDVIDANKTRGLENELLTLQGKSSEVLLRTRQAELLTLSKSDAALKLRIWQLQDETKLIDQRNSQESAIYTLLGNSAAALQITREKELATIDEQLKPAQLYLYALQDEATLKGKLKTAYDKEKTAVKATIDSIDGLIKSLKDAKEAMLVGGLSPLTPAEKYAEAKRQAYAVAAIATGIATTDAEIAARNEAVSKLPSVTGTFLEASRTLFASSEQYTQDFNSVLSVLDATSTTLNNQKTNAEKQLDSLKTTETYLNTIAEDTKTSADYLKDLNDLLPRLISTQAAAAASGSAAAGGTAKTPVSSSVPVMPKSYFEKYEDVKVALTPYITSKNISESQLSALHYAYSGYSEGRENPGIALDTAGAAKAFDVAKESIIKQAKVAMVPYYAKGGLASGLSMVGEQGPELVDFKTPARVYSNTATNQLLSNKELIEEIRRLRTEVSQLRTEQKEQTGHLIQASYDSNAQNAKTIADATEQAAVNTTWSQRSQLKLA